MNNRSMWRALAAAVLIAAGAAVIGALAYNAGVAEGLARSGALTAPPAGAPVVYMWPRPWGVGFFPFFPLLGFIFLFILLRGLLWRGRWGGGWGYRSDGVPPAFDEWHRRAHGEAPRPPADSTS